MSVVGTTFSNSSAQQIVLGDTIEATTGSRFGLAQGQPSIAEADHEPPTVYERNDQVQSVARQISRQSHTSHPTTQQRVPLDHSISRQSSDTVVDHTLFAYDKGSSLDPFSSSFDARQWTRSLVKLNTEAGPSRSSGISFQNMSVHGYGSDAGK